jgi:hypothetical protein
MSSQVVFPREGQGYRAEVQIGDVFHLVLMSTHSALGPAAAVYDVRTKKWMYRDWAEDFDDGKRKAETFAQKFYRAIGNIKEPFPELDWKKTG